MPSPSDKSPHISKAPLSELQKEVTELEVELAKVQNDLRVFENMIHLRLDKEISRLKELSDLYKKQKRDKKLKRLEQKQRGKNYKAPTQLQKGQETPKESSEVSSEEKKELRRLYKDAVVMVHPDKINHGGEHDKIIHATALTAQLNGIYQRGDLEELINFYEFVILGNPITDQESLNMLPVDEKLRLTHLARKKDLLSKQLQELKSAYTYGILTSYEDPLTFIDELYLQLHERIKLMEKRTKKAK
jgi:hypothetical protein